ncbi:MAG: hypothetical protein ACE5GK_05435 [Nitrospiria bacterium]
MDITEMQRMLNKVRCPLCSNAEFDVQLRCDLGLGACLVTARCQSCNTLYELSSEKSPLESRGKQIESRKCPACHTSAFSPAFRCELPTRQCCTVARCKACDHPISASA